MISLPPSDWKDLPARDRLLQTAHALFYRDGIQIQGPLNHLNLIFLK